MESLQVSTKSKKQIVDFTTKVEALIWNMGFRQGICNLWIPHTMAAIDAGEVGGGTDEDLLERVDPMIPTICFRHGPYSSHVGSHMAASILGASFIHPVKEGAVQ